jgi:antitoxin (DNA-binding transcriptional repressor) of toxin-antitoxin stability system
MRVVFRRHRDVPSKNASCLRGPARSAGTPQGVLSFGYFDQPAAAVKPALHKQRKVTRARKGEKALVAEACYPVARLQATQSQAPCATWEKMSSESSANDQCSCDAPDFSMSALTR